MAILGINSSKIMGCNVGILEPQNGSRHPRGDDSASKVLHENKKKRHFSLFLIESLLTILMEFRFQEL